MTRQGIHAAKVESSPRLQRVLRVLQSSSVPLSTRMVQMLANCCNAHTAAAELRANGYAVKVERKGDYFFYSLARGME